MCRLHSAGLSEDLVLLETDQFLPPNQFYCLCSFTGFGSESNSPIELLLMNLRVSWSVTLRTQSITVGSGSGPRKQSLKNQQLAGWQRGPQHWGQVTMERHSHVAVVHLLKLLLVTKYKKMVGEND